MTPQAREEIRIATELAYMPVAMKNKRYNGSDFLEVAIQLKDEEFRENPSIDIEEAAIAMLETFNSKLNPKMSRSDMSGMAKMIAKYSSFTAMLRSVRGY